MTPLFFVLLYDDTFLHWAIYLNDFFENIIIWIRLNYRWRMGGISPLNMWNRWQNITIMDKLFLYWHHYWKALTKDQPIGCIYEGETSKLFKTLTSKSLREDQYAFSKTNIRTLELHIHQTRCGCACRSREDSRASSNLSKLL